MNRKNAVGDLLPSPTVHRSRIVLLVRRINPERLRVYLGVRCTSARSSDRALAQDRAVQLSEQEH